MFAAAIAVIAGLSLTIGTASILPFVAVSAFAWAVAMAIAWSLARARPVRFKGERELEQFTSRVTTYDDEKKIAERLGMLWQRAVGIDMKSMWWLDHGALTTIGGARWTIDKQAAIGSSRTASRSR